MLYPLCHCTTTNTHSPSGHPLGPCPLPVVCPLPSRSVQASCHFLVSPWGWRGPDWGCLVHSWPRELGCWVAVCWVAECWVAAWQVAGYLEPPVPCCRCSLSPPADDCNKSHSDTLGTREYTHSGAIHRVQYNTIQYNTIQYNTIQYNTIQYNTIQYNTITFNSPPEEICVVDIHITQHNTMTSVLTMLIIVVRPFVSPRPPRSLSLPDLVFSSLTEVGRKVLQ